MPIKLSNSIGDLRYDKQALAALNPYALALFLVVGALASTLLLQTVYVGRPSLFPFFAAIAAAAWFGGKGPGYFAGAVSVPLGLYFYVVARPDHDLHIRDFLLFVFFVTCAFLGGALNSRQRKAEDSLRTAHRDLQTKASELQHANDGDEFATSRHV